MRAVLLLVVLAVASCGRGNDRDPKWPERADREEDGGESIEPTPAAIAATTSKDDSKPDDATVAAAAIAAKPADGATPAAVTATPTPTMTPPTITAPD